MARWLLIFISSSWSSNKRNQSGLSVELGNTSRIPDSVAISPCWLGRRHKSSQNKLGLLIGRMPMVHTLDAGPSSSDRNWVQTTAWNKDDLCFEGEWTIFKVGKWTLNWSQKWFLRENKPENPFLWTVKNPRKPSRFSKISPVNSWKWMKIMLIPTFVPHIEFHHRRNIATAMAPCSVYSPKSVAIPISSCGDSRGFRPLLWLIKRYTYYYYGL